MPFSRMPGFTSGWPMAPRRIASKLPQVVDGAVRQHLAGAQIAVAAEVEVRRLVVEARALGGGGEHLDGLGRDFRTGAVTGDDCDLVHVSLLWDGGAARAGRWRRILSHGTGATSARPTPASATCARRRGRRSRARRSCAANRRGGGARARGRRAACRRSGSARSSWSRSRRGRCAGPGEPQSGQGRR